MNTLKVIVLLCGAMVAAGMAFADSASNNQYVCYTVLVNSSTTPVAVLPLIPPFKPTTWTINEWAADRTGTAQTANVLVFPYIGNTLPTAVPSACASPTTTLTATGCNEVTPTKPFSDAVSCDNSSCVGPIGQAFAAALESGSTAEIVTACMR